MSYENKSKVSKRIYDLCKALIEYEKFTKNPKDIQYNGFLIKKELIEILKKNIFYEKFEEGIGLCNFNYKTLKSNIEKACRTKEIKTDIEQTVFNDSNELIKELDRNQFYLINFDLWKVICKKKFVNDKRIIFKFNDKEIILIFNENEKLKFKNNKFIISKETLIENDINAGNKRNFIYKKIASNNKIEIKTLINLFFYYEELKEQLIPLNPEFNPNKKNIVYLISKAWIEKYKSFFNYDKLKSFLIEKQYLSIKNSYNNNENKIEELIEKIEWEIPNEYIEEINNINNINKLKSYEHKYDIKINKITKPINKELKYLNNYEIINSKIYGLFISEKYLENFYIQKCNYYCINENNILIKFISEDKKYIDEILSIEDKNSVNPKYLLDYDGDINNLNNFVKNDFINFCNKNEEYYCGILNENKNIGYCYKLDSINKLEGKIEDESNSLEKVQKESFTGQNNENSNNRNNENHNHENNEKKNSEVINNNENQENESQNNNGQNNANQNNIEQNKNNQNNEGQNNMNQNIKIQINTSQNNLNQDNENQNNENQNNINENNLNQSNSNQDSIEQNNINKNNQDQNNLNQNKIDQNKLNQDDIKQINVNQKNENLENQNQNSINQNNTNQSQENGNNINEISSETENHRNEINENLNNQNNLNENNANKSNDNINNIKANEDDKEKNDGKKNEGDSQNNIKQEITNISGTNNPVLNPSTEEERKKKENEDSLLNKGVQENVELEKLNKAIKEQNQGEKPFEKEINILINIYIFNKILKGKSKENSQSENVNRKKCYLLNKAWVDTYKKIFLYDKLCNYLKDKNTSIKELINNKSIINDVYNYSKNDFDNFDNIKNETQNLIKMQLSPNIKKLQIETKENKDIYYPDEFYIITENIYKKIKENIYKENNEIKLEGEEYNYQKSDVKILLKNINLSSYIKTYIILIVILNDENLFVLESILTFEEKDDRDAVFEILNGSNNDKYYLDMNETNIKSNGKSIGKIFKINNDNRENLLINKYLKTRNKYLELLVSIYLTKFKIKKKIKQEEAKIEKYHIIKRKWICKLLKCCKCENFVYLLNKNNVENIINENKYDNDDILIDKIISLFPSDFINESNIKKED